MAHIDWEKVIPLMGKMFDADVAKIADCHLATIQKKRKSLGIKKVDAYDKNWYHIDPFIETMTPLEISVETGIDINQIYQRKRHLGLSEGRKALDWDEIDKVILQDLKSSEQIAEDFNCHYSSITKRRKKLNVKRSEIDKRWKDIDPYIGKQSNYSVARKFGLYQSSVENRRKTLGVEKFKHNRLEVK